MTNPSNQVEKYQTNLNNNGLSNKIVAKVTVASSKLKEENMASICSYVTLELKDGEKMELFIKEMPENSSHSEMIKGLNVFEREAQFFNEILKELQAFYLRKSG